MNPPNDLRAVFVRIKRGFLYRSDLEQYGQSEFWTFPIDVDYVTGDCEDFAIACRLLIKRDTSHESLLVMCRTEQNESHLVCVSGRWVLDNRQSRICSRFALERQGYRFLYASGKQAGEPWRKLKQKPVIKGS